MVKMKTSKCLVGCLFKEGRCNEKKSTLTNMVTLFSIRDLMSNVYSSGPTLHNLPVLFIDNVFFGAIYEIFVT